MTRLRPVVEADVATLERQHTAPDGAGAQSWFGFREPGSPARRLAAHDTLGDDRGMLAVVVADDGTLVGEVSWLRVFTARRRLRQRRTTTGRGVPVRAHLPRGRDMVVYSKLRGEL